MRGIHFATGTSISSLEINLHLVECLQKAGIENKGRSFLYVCLSRFTSLEQFVLTLTDCELKVVR